MGDKLRTTANTFAALLVALGISLFVYSPGAAALSQQLSPPLLLSPNDKDIVKGINFTQSWGAVEGAHAYEYESYNDAARTQLRAKQEVRGTSKTVSKVPDGTFWWRARAVDDKDKTGQWSSLRRITTDSTPPTIRPIQTIGDKPVQGTVRFVFESVDKHPWRITSGVFSEVPPNGLPIGELDDDSVAEAIDVNVTTRATLNINTLTMPNGKETIIINVEDRAGNVHEERFYFTVANPVPSPETPQQTTPGSTKPKLTQNIEKVSSSQGTGRQGLPVAAPETSENLPETEAGKVLSLHTEQDKAATVAKPDEAKKISKSSYWLPIGVITALLLALGIVKLAQRRVGS